MKNIPFVNHHVHSHFSKLDGLSKPQDIVERVVEMGQESISITDHGFMSGIPQMYAEAKKAGIGFTPGIEAYFAKDRNYKHADRNGEAYYHLLMLATSDEGYKNLVKMQTPAWEEGFYRHPRIDYEIMEKYSKDIVVTTSCLSGIVSRLLLKGDQRGAREEVAALIDIFGKDNVFVEIQRHGIKDQENILGDLVDISKEFKLPLLATADSHYTRESDCDVHDTLLCCSAGGNKFASGDQRFKFDSTKNFLHSGEQMMELFPEEDFPGAVTNTYELAMRTKDSAFSLPMNTGEYILPNVPVEEGKTEIETLRSQVYRGASELSRYGDDEGNISQEVKDRIEYELEVIDNMGFPGYFLIVANYIQLFKDNGIVVGHGRGCLDQSTDVLTDSGWKKIVDVNPGDYVIDSLGKMSKVLQLHEHDTYDDEYLVRLVDEDGQYLVLTDKHKVLTMNERGERDWIPAMKIRPGKSIVHATGSHQKDFQYFDGLPHGRLDDSLRKRVIKDSSWGYICALLVIHASINSISKYARWSFDENTSLVSETLLSLLDSVFPESTEHTRRDGVITEIVFKDVDVNKWAINKRKDNDLFVGVGTKEFTFGFISALQSSFSAPVCSTSIIRVDDNNTAEILCNSIRSAGINFTRDNTTIFIDSLRSYGITKLKTVIKSERIPAQGRKVYDLTVEGHPSFLTSFGTVHNSAPGSVVVYCLGITNVDPFRHNLHFERFLNPDRISMPDIDIDIPKTKRGEALKLLEEEYGHGHVAQISNYAAMKTKDSLERVAKAYGMSPAEAQILKKSVEDYCEANNTSLEEIVSEGKTPKDIIKGASGNKNIDVILHDASVIDGTISSYGTHACGIVITTERIDDHFPVRFNTTKGKPVGLPICQYDGHDIEALGGVKMDLLGLTNLDQASDAQRNIKLDLGVDVDPFNLPLDDKDTYELLSRGAGGDIFQLGCLAGDTIIEGRKISHWYQLRHSTQRASFIKSVYMGEGHVHNNRVVDVVYSGIKDTVVLEYGDRHIQCTPDHHIFTDRGWKEAGSLREGDKVLSVDENINGESYLPTLRGRQDILDVFEMMNPDWERFDTFTPVSSRSTTFYPSFHKYGSLSDLVLIYPDENHHEAMISVDEFNSVEGNNLIALSYSQVIEKFYASEHIDDDYLTPVGTEFVTIDSISDGGEVKTYDIMMSTPVNNYVANGIMVHNSSGIRELMREMKPTRFEDISALLALYRPGPIDMNTHKEYAVRKNSPGDDYPIFHDDARELLKSTYGLCVYQEDIMGASQIFAGYSGGEADTLRKAVGKKIPELMEEQKKKFIPAVNERYYDGLGEEIWDIIAPFGQYAFNRCLHGKTTVITENGSCVRIQDLYNYGGFSGVKILSMWEDGTIKPHSIKDIVKSGEKPVYTVKTKNGRTILITEDHRMLTTEGYGSIVDGKVSVGKELISDDNEGEKRATEYQPTLDFSDKHCHQKSTQKTHGGRVSGSRSEAMAAEYLINRGINFEMHKILESTDESHRTTDFYAQGIYFEMDGMHRGRQWFVDNKYGDDIPFVYMTPLDYKDRIDEALMRHSISNGDEIIEIVPPRTDTNGLQQTEMTYDIEMEDSGPSNFIANGLVSHNSHSVAYASLSYLTAWLKAHYTPQFAGACIDYNISNKAKLLATMAWVREEGVNVLPPNVNLSQMRTVTSEDSVTLPLDIINGLGESQALGYIDEREENGQYTSVVDFVSRNKVSEKMLVLLAKSGAFDCFDHPRVNIVSQSADIMAEASMVKSRNDFLSDSLFADMFDDENDEEETNVDLDKEVDSFFDDNSGHSVDVDDDLYARWERESIGFIIGPHPFGTIRKLRSSRFLFDSYAPVDTIVKKTEGRGKEKFCGIITNIDNRRSRKGDPFSKFDLETENAVVSGMVFKKHVKEEWEGCLVGITGRVDNEAESDFHKNNNDGEDTDEFIPKVKCSEMKKVNVEKLKARG